IRDWSVTGVQTCALPIFPNLESRATGCLFSASRVVVVAPPLENEAGAWPLPGRADPPSGGGGAGSLPPQIPAVSHTPRHTRGSEIGRASCREKGESLGGG